MKYCWDDNRNKTGNRIKVFFSLLLIGIAMVKTVENLFLLHSLWSLSHILSIGLACVVTYFCVMFLLIIVAHERRYEITSQGLTLCYPFGIRRNFAWQDISDISVCKVHFIKRGPIRSKIAIRFAIGPEIAGPQQAQQADERWSEEIYEIMHWEKIITIEFSEERLREVTAVSSIEVSDYRHLPNPC